jgi:hypothetical protein
LRSGRMPLRLCPSRLPRRYCPVFTSVQARVISRCTRGGLTDVV